MVNTNNTRFSLVNTLFPRLDNFPYTHCDSRSQEVTQSLVQEQITDEETIFEKLSETEKINPLIVEFEHKFGFLFYQL